VRKTYLSETLGHRACRDGFSTLKCKYTRLLGELELARKVGNNPSIIKKMAGLSRNGWPVCSGIPNSADDKYENPKIIRRIML
jgi:hypothetical protein